MRLVIIAIVLVFRKYVTIEYTLEPIFIQRVPKFGLYQQCDDLPIVREDERHARVPRGSQMMICEE